MKFCVSFHSSLTLILLFVFFLDVWVVFLFQIKVQKSRQVGSNIDFTTPVSQPSIIASNMTVI